MPTTIESANQAMVPIVEAIMARRGGIAPGARVLDFGCGVGRHTREFRAAGYMAEGVDRPYQGLVEDLAALPDGGDHIHLSTAEHVFPFDDKIFDFCFSTSVLEHVMSYDEPISEIVRTLKPGAWTLHVFPARWRPIESHMYTPLGGRFQHPCLFQLWAKLGIHNEYQREFSSAETAQSNARYSRTGINYPTKRQIKSAFSRHFAQVEFVEAEFVAATREVSRVSALMSPLMRLPGVEAIYRGFHTRVILARKA